MNLTLASDIVQLEKFILSPRIVEVPRIVEKIVEKDRIVHLPKQDDRSLKMELSLSLLVEKQVGLHVYILPIWDTIPAALPFGGPLMRRSSVTQRATTPAVTPPSVAIAAPVTPSGGSSQKDRATVTSSTQMSATRFECGRCMA